MLRVPYMKDAHSRRVWLDRCPKCRAIWFDAGEPEATAGHDLQLEISAVETWEKLRRMLGKATTRMVVSKNTANTARLVRA